MKRTIFLISTAIVIILVFISYKYIQYQSTQREAIKYNQDFLQYNRNNLYGTDITSVINKAISNNEENKIEKDESGEYISDELKSIKIYINFEEEGSTYAMEKLYKRGIQDFTKLFGGVRFKCTNVKYHSNGKVSEMYFQAINY